MPCKYVLFDLDGTLTDSQEGIVNSIVYSLEVMGRPVPDKETLKRFIGPPLMDSYTGFLGMSRQDAARAVVIYREYFTRQGMFENRVYDGIPEMLTQLRRRGLILAVATSKPEPFSRQILAHFGLDGFFDFIGGSRLDETRGAKWEVIEHTLEQLGVTDRSEVVMVGDRLHDAEGARICGIPCVGVLFGFGSREELEAAGVIALADSPAALPDIL